MATWWEQLLTFGAKGRIETAGKNYQDLLAGAQALSGRIEGKRTEVQAVLQALIKEKTESLPSLHKIGRIANNLSIKDRQYNPEVPGDETPLLSVAKIHMTLDAASAAQTGAKGLVAGTSTALGAWALVGSLGTASTGTALSTLSGAAATNATLAWFGGGSMAAGGAGMAGGAAVLGGVVALPTLAVMVYFAHSKANKEIRKIEIASSKLDKAIDDMKKIELVLEIANRRGDELIQVIRKARNGFEEQLEFTYSNLYPYGWLSRIWRYVRRVIGIGYFKQPEVKEIQTLLHSAAEFAGILDQKVFDEGGTVLGGTN